MDTPIRKTFYGPDYSLSYILPSRSATMRVIYALPAHGLQEITSFVCQDRCGKTVANIMLPELWPIQVQEEFITLDSKCTSKTIIENLSIRNQIYLAVDLVKYPLNFEDLKEKCGSMLNNPYWQNQDEVWDYVVDILDWQKQNRNKVPFPDDFFRFQHNVMKCLLARVNEFKRIQYERYPQLVLTSRGLFDPGQDRINHFFELESELQSLVNDIQKLQESYELLDPTQDEVSGYLKGLENEILDAVRESEVLSSSLDNYFAVVLQYFPFYLPV